MPYIPVATGSDLGRWSGERVVNMIPHQTPSGMSEYALLGRNGLRSYLGTGEVRALADSGSTLAYVAGTTLYVDGSTTPVSSGGRAWIAIGSTHTAAVVNGTYYVWNGTAFSTPATGAITTPAGVVHKDGYFILWGADGTREDVIQWSAVDDATSFNALDFATADTAGDRIQAITDVIGGLKVFGSETVEDWYNTGAGWDRSSPSGIRIGCRDGKTVARHMESVFWVGVDDRVYLGQGSLAVAISPEWVERGISSLPSGDVNLQYGFIYKDRGHTMYCLSRESDGESNDLTTIVYDLDTQRWFEFDTSDGSWLVTSTAHQIFVRDGTYVSAQIIGTREGLAIMDYSTTNDLGYSTYAMAITPPLNNAGQPVQIGDVRLMIDSEETGVSPSVWLSVRRDFGAFGAEEEAIINETRGEAVWRAKGQADNVGQLRFMIDDDHRRDVYGVIYGGS